MANEIEFEIVARLDNIENALGSVESSAKKTNQVLESNFTKTFASITAAAIAAGTAIVTYLAGAGIKKAIAASAEQEAAVNQLNQSLLMAGRFSEEASLRMQNFASTIQKTTTIQDDQALSLLALAGNFTKTNDEAQQLTKAAIDLSAATGKDLESSLQVLGKSLSGLPVGKIIPQLKEMTAEQLRAGAAIDFVAQRFAGAAEGQLNTFSGALKQLGNLFNDFLESVGDLVVKSPVVRELFKFLSLQVMRLTDAFTGLQKSGDIVGDLIKQSIQWGIVMNKFLVAPLELVYNLTVTVFNAIRTGVQEIIAIISTAVQGILQIAGIFTDKFKGAEEAVTQFTESSNAVLSDFANKTQESFNNTLDFSITGAADNFLTQLDDMANRAAVPLQKLQDNVKNTMAQAKITTIITADFFKTQFVSTFSNAFQAVGVALAKGQNAFAAFGKSLLSAMGDFAIKLGEMIITSAIATKFLKDSLLTFGGFGAAIAAGAALIAVGAALKTFAGGPSGASAGGEGAAGGAGTAAPIGESTSSLQTPERQTPGSSIQVNIAGSVLGDKRTLGREVADALNEAFGADGIVLSGGAVVS